MFTDLTIVGDNDDFVVTAKDVHDFFLSTENVLNFTMTAEDLHDLALIAGDVYDFVLTEEDFHDFAVTVDDVYKFKRIWGTSCYILCKSIIVSQAMF